MSQRNLGLLVTLLLLVYLAQSCTDKMFSNEWLRPIENPVFTTAYGNNHDPIIFYDAELEYPYHLMVSGWHCGQDTVPQAFLWRAKAFSWSSSDWELVSENYTIGCYYEYDDGVKVDGKYYIYESGVVYTFSGPLENSSGNWEKAGTFPKTRCDDVGVFYEDGVFHLFGEFGKFEYGHDGTSLSHLVSRTGTGDWKLVDSLAVNPNEDGKGTYGVGDATIAKISDTYYLYCDVESKDQPYRITAWKSNSLYEKFEPLGVVIAPRENATKNWDDYRIQDGDVLYVPELSKYVMLCNMMDKDGDPGGKFPRLKNASRVVGTFMAGK